MTHENAHPVILGVNLCQAFKVVNYLTLTFIIFWPNSFFYLQFQNSLVAYLHSCVVMQLPVAVVVPPVALLPLQNAVCCIVPLSHASMALLFPPKLAGWLLVHFLTFYAVSQKKYMHHSFISIVVIRGGNWRGTHLQCGAEVADAVIAQPDCTKK